MTVILGRNGVGKTTLLKSLMGVVPVKTGTRHARRQGHHHGHRPTTACARGIGYVPQGREIFGRLTVEENLRMGLATKPGGTPIPAELFELFPVLKQMLQRRGGDLSGGQQQQLAIARALAAGPKLLMLDEPTEGIQPSIIKDIGRVIRMLADRKTMAIVLVEQYYDFAAETRRPVPGDGARRDRSPAAAARTWKPTACGRRCRSERLLPGGALQSHDDSRASAGHRLGHLESARQPARRRRRGARVACRRRRRDGGARAALCRGAERARAATGSSSTPARPLRAAWSAAARVGRKRRMSSAPPASPKWQHN